MFLNFFNIILFYMSAMSKSQVDNMGLSSYSQSPGLSPQNCNVDLECLSTLMAMGLSGLKS